MQDFLLKYLGATVSMACCSAVQSDLAAASAGQRMLCPFVIVHVPFCDPLSVQVAVYLIIGPFFK